jgi:hypothetical protein
MIIIRQKEFAFRDYEGLDEISKANLRKERSELAKELNESRNRANKTLERKLGNLNTATDIYANSNSDINYKNIGAAHGGEVRQMVNEHAMGKSPEAIKDDIYRERNAKYNNVLRDTKTDSDLFRRDELKGTKIREDTAKLEERIKAYRRAKESRESIAKHEAKAAKLRAKKKTGEMLKKGGKAALITGGVVAAGYGAKKLYDKKKENQK